MNRLLQDNPIGLVLAGIGSFLLFCMLAIALSSYLPLGRVDPADAGSADGAFPDLPELKASEPLEAYSVIVQRPLFNESRLPVIEPDPDASEGDEDLVAADDTELEVELSGVVITPTLRIATLKRKDGSKSLVAIEGEPLEGEFGSWQLTEVQTRKVTLVSGVGKELELGLQVHDERIEPPAMPAVPDPQAQPGVEPDSAEQASDEPLSRADEIRQRIAERREQLRQQAEAEDQAGEQDAQPTYEEAIRAMINRRPAPKDEPESKNEQ